MPDTQGHICSLETLRPVAARTPIHTQDAPFVAYFRERGTTDYVARVVGIVGLVENDASRWQRPPGSQDLPLLGTPSQVRSSMDVGTEVRADDYYASCASSKDPVYTFEVRDGHLDV